jgi:glyoxylase-like metal-dependent hydrolase (beta-lactamase superfamily II)
VLLAGDMLSDIEPPLPESPDNLAAYDAGLVLLRPFVESAAVLVPGHGTPTERPMDRWVADRRFLDAVAAGADPEDPRLPPTE